MNDMTIQEFCDIHSACAEGRNWALANCTSMQDAWEKLRPEWLIWVATRNGVLADRELRLFAVWCARKVQHLMADPRSVSALDVAERHADGKATDVELFAAAAAAWAAARDAGADAAAAAWAAARDEDAEEAAAWTAAWAAGRWSEEEAAAAAWTAARAAARAAEEAGEAARAEARDAQAEWLRKNCNPNFKEAKP